MTPLRLAVLVSGRGSNLRALLEAHDAGKLPFVEFSAVVTNKPGAPALEYARERGIPAIEIDHRPFGRDRAAHEKAIIEELRNRRTEGIVLAGYMRIVTPTLLQAFPGSIVNIHPSLLPAFPGVNGQKQALDYGARWAGCTVHFVNEETDGGPIILQRIVPVLQDDNEQRLAARILAEEHMAFPLALDLWSRGRLVLDGRRIVIVQGEGSFPELEADLHAVTPLLLATGNDHKVSEIAAILSDLPIRLLNTRGRPNDSEPEESGNTYLENARIKARHWHERTGLWCLADDSGLEVDALDGRPGIASNRYAPTAEERNARLLAELREVEASRRTARFVCTVVLLGPDGEEYTATGTCEGRIGFEPRGEGGFGYDPVFVPDGFEGKHLAELPVEVKNRISHRATALKGLENALRRLFCNS